MQPAVFTAATGTTHTTTNHPQNKRTSPVCLRASAGTDGGFAASAEGERGDGAVCGGQSSEGPAAMRQRVDQRCIRTAEGCVCVWGGGGWPTCCVMNNIIECSLCPPLNISQLVCPRLPPIMQHLVQKCVECIYTVEQTITPVGVNGIGIRYLILRVGCEESTKYSRYKKSIQSWLPVGLFRLTLYSVPTVNIPNPKYTEYVQI